MRRTVGDIYRRNRLLNPRGTAILHEGSRLTHAELADRGERLGAGLAAHGVRFQDRVAILSMNRPEFAEFYAGCAMAGFVGAPVNFRLTRIDIEWVLRDCAPRALIFEDQYTDDIEAIRAGLDIDLYICIGDAPSWAVPYECLVDNGDPAGAPFRPAVDDLYVILYTSGTTGRPKGVLSDHFTEVHHCAVLTTVLEINGSDRLLVMMPFFHAGAHSQFITAMWRGATVVLHRGFDPAAIVSAIEVERVTHVHLAPTLLQGVLDVPGAEVADLSSVRTILYSAAPMPVPLLRRALGLFGPVFVNGYGLTELTATILHKHQHVLDGKPEQVARLGSVGQVIEDGELAICDDVGRPLGVREIGEIRVRTATAMRSYWNNDVATLAAVEDDWFKTGDMGYLDEEGYLFLVDRKKDMIISGGENIYSREVEEALSRHPCVAEVAVIGIPDDRWGEAVHAVVTLRAGAHVEADVLIAHCKEEIARYKAPKGISFVDALPHLPSGKVDKRALRSRYCG